MPAQIKTYHQRNLSETRIPLWQFAGLALLGVAIAFGVYANSADEQERSTFLQNPQAGDVYEYKTEGGNYTTFRLVNVTTDSVIVNFNSFEVDGIGGISKLDKAENYNDTLLYALSRAELKDMHQKGTIIDINRK